MSDTDFLPAYLVLGADELKRRYVLQRLEKRISALGDLDFNRDVFTGSAQNASQIVSACNTLPFACEYRLVIVHEAGALASHAGAPLVDYLKSPCSTTILALDAAKLAKNTKLYKAVAALGKKAIIDCSPKKNRDLPSQARDFAASHGVTLTPRAAQLLVDLVGDSTMRLDAEVQKLASAYGQGSQIDCSQVKEHVARTAKPKPWLFTDALGARNAKRCLELVALDKGQSPYALMARSVTYVRELLIACDAEGEPLSVLAGRLHRPEWQARNIASAAKNFSARELADALVSAAETDARMKSGFDPDLAFEQWMLGVCGCS